MPLTIGQPIWARYFSQATQGYVVKPLGKVQRVEPDRVLVNGKWHPTSALGRGLYASEEEGLRDVAERPFKRPYD